jgi:hypothetical protein
VGILVTSGMVLSHLPLRSTPTSGAWGHELGITKCREKGGNGELAAGWEGDDIQPITALSRLDPALLHPLVMVSFFVASTPVYDTIGLRYTKKPVSVSLRVLTANGVCKGDKQTGSSSLACYSDFVLPVLRLFLTLLSSRLFLKFDRGGEIVVA